MNPLRLRRLSYATILAGGVAGGIAGAIRQAVDHASTVHSLSYLLDVAALGIEVAAVVMAIRSGSILLESRFVGAKSRSILLAIAGISMALIACVLVSTLSDRGTGLVFSVVAYGLIYVGIGAGASGIGSLAWVYGGNYAAEKIEERRHEDF